jgi:hypothetical protein
MARGEGGTVDDRTIEEVAEGVRALLVAVDAGEIEVTVAQRAYLEGTVDTLTAISKRAMRQVAPGWC